MTPTERLERLDAALALYGSAKRWVERAGAGFLMTAGATVAIGWGAPPAAYWLEWAGAIAGGVCMSLSVSFYWRAGKALRGAR